MRQEVVPRRLSLIDACREHLVVKNKEDTHIYKERTHKTDKTQTHTLGGLTNLSSNPLMMLLLMGAAEYGCGCGCVNES